MRSLGFLALLLVALSSACTRTPTAPTPWTIDRLREQLAISNLNNAALGASGRLTRWQVPILVNTNGIARAEIAISHYEQWTGGVVRFTRVTGTPANGLIFHEGGAGGHESDQSCGSVFDAQAAGSPATFRWDQTRAIGGAYAIHLGTESCNDSTAGAYPSAVAEHMLAHALGILEHFDGFQNRGGLDDPRLLAVVYNLYANPPGAAANELTIWGAR